MSKAGSTAVTPERLARLEHLLDRQDILDCLTRFSRGMDRFDREIFLSAFHPDAVIAAGDFVGGPDKLYDWAADMHDKGQSATHHNLLNHTCEIDGDVAHTETYYLFVARNRDETNWIAGGRYIDRTSGGTDPGGSPCVAMSWNGPVWSPRWPCPSRTCPISALTVLPRAVRGISPIGGR